MGTPSSKPEASKSARYVELWAEREALPPHFMGEIMGGELYAQARPATRHARCAGRLGGDLESAFDRGRGGPGGWIVLPEPELHWGEDVLVPDLAGWRKTRMPELLDVPFVELAPNWVCEVLSPSTQARDRRLKLPIYQRESIEHVWLVDPQTKVLEVFRLDGPSYRLVAVHEGDEHIQAEPFEAVRLELGMLWLD